MGSDTRRALKRYCFLCGGKLKFVGITETEPKPSVLRLCWYRCTQCGSMEWRMIMHD